MTAHRFNVSFMCYHSPLEISADSLQLQFVSAEQADNFAVSLYCLLLRVVPLFVVGVSRIRQTVAITLKYLDDVFITRIRTRQGASQFHESASSGCAQVLYRSDEAVRGRPPASDEGMRNPPPERSMICYPARHAISPFEGHVGLDSEWGLLLRWAC
jgi:hypothetical protein